jgi:hypothetical protein
LQNHLYFPILVDVNPFPSPSMLFGSKKSGKAPDPNLVAVHWVVVLLYLLVTIAAGVGVYKSHLLSSGATFGTTSGSLSIIAFVLSLTVLLKAVCCSGCCKK